MKIILKIKGVLVLFFALSLTGCVLPKYSVENLNEVAADEILFIGRVSMNPPITKEEIQIENVINLSDVEMHKVLVMKASDVYYELGGQHATDYQDTVAAIDGEYYYFTWNKNKPLNFLGVTFITRMTSRNREYMTFTIDKGIKVNHSGKSKAVYVGDITFVRDEFFNIKDIDINQKNYKKAVKEFRKKYKTDWKVEKAKLTSSK
ncbi:MAG: hypothetical protein OEY06_07995 [Gammaproteobacteria bacterium]|nr:hypothetical protein [Gammaproteobacteria bacterium]MDH5388376.1 hypothetical protein [Gammaproteobacteria bacterium]